MPRLPFAVAGWVVLATLQVGGQQPRGTTAAPPQTTVAGGTLRRIDPPRLLPGTPPDVFSTIQGNALTAANSSLASAVVRLRDARVGQIVELQVTDHSGLFNFRSLDPGSYIVEILGQDQASVLAASQVLDVAAGQALTAVVKLPYNMSPLASVFGNSTPSITAVASQAASAGVLASQASGAATCETLR